jgi:hypothetical protein
MRRGPANKVASQPRQSTVRAHRSRRAALEPFLIAEATLTRGELLRARAADPYWRLPAQAT